jgi:glycosyltransferase involved in cell wall biosynthesis
MNRFTDLFIFNSETSLKSYSRYLDREKSRVIYQWVINPVPETSPARLKANIFRCLLIGHLSEKKRQFEAIEAIALLRKRGKSVNLDLVGHCYDGHIEDLKALVTKRGVHPYVRFRGYLEDIGPSLETADAVLVCSRNESFGRVTIEAMLAGIPVIAAADGGTVELIENDRNGYLYPAGCADKLAERIGMLIDRPSISERTVNKAKQWAQKNFGRQRFGDQMENALVTVYERHKA